MNSRRLWIPTTVLFAILIIPCSAHAQETGVSGIVTDATDAVLPGVTVTAVHNATGNNFVAVTDAEGRYRLPTLRSGVYKVTAELSGFNTVTQDGLELLVGQQATRNFKLTLSGVQESITVSSEVPLIEMRQSSIAGNIDTRQMEALPLNGRNWMQLTVLAPGARVNSAQADPMGNQAGSYQINMDGQQVSSTWSGGSLGGPHFSRDAIAEFQLVSSRFDATQGRSMGIQINAVTKAGTNNYAGSLSGYFRDDRFNAKSPVLNRVVPYSDQQISGTIGGPIRHDKLHFFGNYEYERQPSTIIWNVPYPVFNIADTKSIWRQDYAGVRVDAVLTSNTRLMVRGSGWKFNQPVTGSSTAHPSTRGYAKQANGQVFASLIHTTGRMVNEIKGGYTGLVTKSGPLIKAPMVSLAGGFSIGSGNGPTLGSQHTLSVRDDLTLFRGRHELKMGGELLRPSNRIYFSRFQNGVIDATLGPVPANIGALFPVADDPSTWNLAELSSITRRYTQGIGTFEIFCIDSPRTCRRRKPEVGAWFQDNWTVSSALTVNLGIRWDFALDGLANDVEYPFVPVYPHLPRIHDKQPQQWNNFGPRLGFAYSLPDKKTVLRGGWGLYFAGLTDRPAQGSLINLAYSTFEVLNDQRSNFAADPFNLAGGGKIPTLDDAQAQSLGQRRGTPSLIYTGRNPYSYQTSVGIQRQFGRTMAVTADYVWVAGRNEPITRNMNLSFNPMTGVNFPFSDVSHRPYPQFGSLSIWDDTFYSNYHGLETSFTKRFTDRWQASVTYTLAGTWDYYPEPINPGCVGPINGLTMTCDTYFKVQPDLGGAYSLKGAGGRQTVTEPDQRHRMVLNGIYQLSGGFQVSGLYLYSSGIRQQSTYGRDLRDVGVDAEFGGGRLRADGTVIPRNSVLDDPIHRVDLRVQWRRRIGRASFEPLVEVFNLFNSTNFTRNWVELSPKYGKPIGQSLGSEYRTLQLGVRTTF